MNKNEDIPDPLASTARLTCPCTFSLAYRSSCASVWCSGLGGVLKCLIAGLETGHGGERAQARVSKRRMEEGVCRVPNSLRE